jgi:hypothetical protein
VQYYLNKLVESGRARTVGDAEHFKAVASA